MLDLVEGGSTWEEVVSLAQAVEVAGATMINTGIGWHEARIPTIATMVPRAAFAWVTRRLMGEVKIPLITTNRINDPATAETLLARGDADMVSMARPFLADPEFVRKAALGGEPRLNRRASAEDLRGFDEVILSSGIVPRRPPIPGLDHPKVAGYVEIVEGRKIAGMRVAIVGAGGIGFDVAEFLTAGESADGHASDGRADDPAIAAFRAEWGIDSDYATRGGLKL